VIPMVTLEDLIRAGTWILSEGLETMERADQQEAKTNIYKHNMALLMEMAYVENQHNIKQESAWRKFLRPTMLDQDPVIVDAHFVSVEGAGGNGDAEDVGGDGIGSN